MWNEFNVECEMNELRIKELIINNQGIKIIGLENSRE